MPGTDVTVDIALGTENGQMVITAPTADAEETVWDGSDVTFALGANLAYPNAYILAVEFLDANGDPTLNQNGPFQTAPGFNGNLQTRTGTVQNNLADSSWRYRVWVSDGANTASHDPTLLNRKG